MGCICWHKRGRYLEHAVSVVSAVSIVSALSADSAASAVTVLATHEKG